MGDFPVAVNISVDFDIVVEVSDEVNNSSGVVLDTEASGKFDVVTVSVVGCDVVNSVELRRDNNGGVVNFSVKSWSVVTPVDADCVKNEGFVDDVVVGCTLEVDDVIGCSVALIVE